MNVGLPGRNRYWKKINLMTELELPAGHWPIKPHVANQESHWPDILVHGSEITDDEIKFSLYPGNSSCVIQWNLRITDTFGTHCFLAISSFVERLSFIGG